MTQKNNSDFRFMALHSVFTFIRQIFVGLIGIASAVLIARIYGPDGNGIFAMAILLPTLLAMLLNLGMSAANVYLISSGASHVREAIVGNIILSGILSFCGLGIGFITIEFFANSLFPGIEKKILWLTLALFPIILISGFLTSIFHGLQKFGIFNKILLFEPIIFLIGILIIPTSNHQMMNLIILKILSSVITLCFIIFRSYQAWRDSEPKVSYPLRFIKKASDYGFKANLGPITQFLNYKIDIFILNFFTDVTATGIYVVAVTLAEKLFLLSGAISTILFPKLSQLATDERSRKELTPFVSRIVLFLTLFSALGLAVFAYTIINRLFGIEFLASLYPLLILIPGVTVISVAKIWANDIAARGKPEINMYISMITLVFNTIGNIILIPRIGMAGAALTTTLSYLLSSVLTLHFYIKLTKNTVSSVFWFGLSDLRRLRKAIVG